MKKMIPDFNTLDVFGALFFVLFLFVLFISILMLFRRNIMTRKVSLLQINESMALDTKRRLVRVQHQGIEHLLLLGPSNDLLLQSLPVQHSAESQKRHQPQPSSPDSRHCLEMKEDSA